MKTYEILTATFSKLIKAMDKDSAKIAYEQMFKDAEIIEWLSWLGSINMSA